MALFLYSRGFLRVAAAAWGEAANPMGPLMWPLLAGLLPPAPLLSPVMSPLSLASFLRGLHLNRLAHQHETHLSLHTLGYAPVDSSFRCRPLPALYAHELPRNSLGYGRGGFRPFRSAKLVVETSQPLVRPEVCAAIRREAARAMAAGARSSFTMTETNRDVAVHELPRTLRWLNAFLPAVLEPTVRLAFGDCLVDGGSRVGHWVRTQALRLTGTGETKLIVYRALVVQYDEAARLTHQPVHRDASLISMIVPLNDCSEYKGGGTYIEPLSKSIVLPQGHALLHPSAVRHAGHRLTAGERWVLVVFLSTREPRREEHSRRFKERARAMGESGDLMGELAVLRHALRLSPSDHELWYDAGAALHDAGKLKLARRYYERAIALNDMDPQPHNNLGGLLLELGSPPREALHLSLIHI